MIVVNYGEVQCGEAQLPAFGHLIASDCKAGSPGSDHMEPEVLAAVSGRASTVTPLYERLCYCKQRKQTKDVMQ